MSRTSLRAMCSTRAMVGSTVRTRRSSRGSQAGSVAIALKICIRICLLQGSGERIDTDWMTIVEIPI